MPRYDYECPKCETKYEISHPISMPTLATDLPPFTAIAGGKLCCEQPGCKQKPLTKLVSAPAVRAVVRGNSDFSERERSRLIQRSDEHWQKKGYKEAVERVVAKGLPPTAVPKGNPNR